MAILRVNKNSDYTVVSNIHLKDKRLSLKAKGLLTLMLSLPDNWDYSIKGLCAICKENETAISSAIKELKENGYVVINKLNPNKQCKRFTYVYDIYETPQDLDYLGLESLGVENHPLNKILNNKILNNKINNNNITGVYMRVSLSITDYNTLIKRYNKTYIDEHIKLLDEYLESNNNKGGYTNMMVLMERSIKEEWFNHRYIKVDSEKRDKFKKALKMIK